MKSIDRRMHRAIAFSWTAIIVLFISALVTSSAGALFLDSGVIRLSNSGYNRAYSVAFSPDGGLLAAGTATGIFIFDSQTREQLHFISTDAPVRSIAFAPNGEVLASGSYDPIVRLWSVHDGSLLREMKAHSAWVRCVSYSPDGTILATASDDDTITLWDLASGNPINVLHQDTQGVRTVTFSPDGTLLASGGYDRVVRLWQVQDGLLLRELSGHTDWVRSLAFSPDGSTLASGAFDATIRLWRVIDGELLATRTEHSSSVLGLEFSPDGNLLASASVDTSVRLWKMPDLKPYDLLIGHSDFVYSVAFSTDGQSLSSGGADNTVRIWEVSPNSNEAAQERISAPSNCKACHHPRSGPLPPRVIEPNCSTCHQDSALVLSWCPALDRTPGGTTLQVAYDPEALKGSAPQTAANFGVAISTPGNGEHFYTHPDVFAVIRIDGYIFTETTLPKDVELELQVWSGKEQVSTLFARPGSNGHFSFSANIRPEGGDPFFSPDGHQFYCLNCHQGGMTGLPPGRVRLVIIATAADGSQASDERIIYVDHSSGASIPVNLLFENGRPVPGIPLQASTRLYEWRGRGFTAISDAQGRADLQVEALSEIPTKYRIGISPVVLDGIRYESVEAVEINLPPAASSAMPVTLHVRATTGNLSGQLTPASTGSIDILAIHLPDGAIFRTESSPESAFALPDLPIGRYLVTGSEQELAAQGWLLKPQAVDLSQNPSTALELPLVRLSGASLLGIVREDGGEPLPFAYVTVADLPISQAVLPDSGRFTVLGLPAEEHTLQVSAPGFYSQAHVVEVGNIRPLELGLVMRPETRRLPWGEGEVLLPEDSQVLQEGLQLTLEQGWIWGSGGSAAQPLKIILGETEIDMGPGSFALESTPGGPAWFYVFEGAGHVRLKKSLEVVLVASGQMIVLSEDAKPVAVPYAPEAVAVLHEKSEPPLEPAWQPSLKAQLRDRLAQLGISTAQVLTLLTYLMAALLVIALPVVIIRWSSKRKRATRDN